jgi:predicted DNA-binding protein (MmcQ/YjbR family)
MDIEWVRRHCLSFPHATERVQWGDHLVFKVADKIFAILALEPSGQFLCCKCTPEEFAELVERPSVIPAPYMARAHWVALESEDALSAAEIKRLVGRSYELVVAKMPKRKQAELRKER